MTPVELPATDSQFKLAIGTILTGLLALVGLGIRRSTPVLIDRVVKQSVDDQFGERLARIDATADTCTRLELKVDEQLVPAVERIERTLDEFQRAIGRLEGAGVRTPISLMHDQAIREGAKKS